MRPLSAGMAGVAVLGGVYVLCISVGASALEALQLVGWAAGGALAVGILGGVSLRLLRGAAIALQIGALMVLAIGAVTVGTLAATSFPGPSGQDIHPLLAAATSAGVVGVFLALAFGNRVEADRTALADLARSMGNGHSQPRSDSPFVKEFAELSSELAETAARLEESRRRERTLEASRRELITWISHDLRTPLAGIRAMSEALSDGVVTDRETVTRYLNTVRTESDRLAALVEDLFELNRIQAGEMNLDVQPMLLADVVSDALAGATPLADRRGVKLTGAVSEPRLRVNISTPAFSRVLDNLLANAIRETPPGGKVWLGGTREDGCALITVADTCGGIPDSQLSRLFDTGFRGEPSRSRGDDARAGLGLAIARGLVEAHDGAISVANDANGCRFQVQVPLG